MRYAESDMNIQSLHIKNFKNFEDKKLEFAEGFNLIVGNNGTGKTALLEALSMGLGGFLNEIAQHPNQPNENKVRIQGILSGEIFTFEPQYPMSLNLRGISLTQEFFWSFGVNDSHFNFENTLKFTANEIRNSVQNGKNIILPM